MMTKVGLLAKTVILLSRIKVLLNELREFLSRLPREPITPINKRNIGLSNKGNTWLFHIKNTPKKWLKVQFSKIFYLFIKLDLIVYKIANFWILNYC